MGNLDVREECYLKDKGCQYHFSSGPWSIHEGEDVFGPAVRPTVDFAKKLKIAQELGFTYVQFHDDDAVPGLPELSATTIADVARSAKKALDDLGLAAEFVAPRLWEAPEYADGAYTSNDPGIRMKAIERSCVAIDIAHELDTDLIVLWLAREGTNVHESKDPVAAMFWLVEAINTMLEHDPAIRIAIEPKPNEPVSQAFIPTAGHGLVLASMTTDPTRVGINVESAHAILAGLNPAYEMAMALSVDKLWSVHLNDQDGVKYDQDRAFGMVNPRRAFNQVLTLHRHEYWKKGVVGLDVKALRTQPAEVACKHLRNSKEMFLQLLEVVEEVDLQLYEDLVGAGDLEELDWYVTTLLMRLPYQER